MTTPPPRSSAVFAAIGPPAAVGAGSWAAAALPPTEPGPWSGPLVMAALVLAVAGVAKAVRPHAAGSALAGIGLPVPIPAVRALGGVEVAVGCAVALAGGRSGGAAVAGCYAAFAAVSFRLARTPGTEGCGCFGSADVQAGGVHYWLNVVVAGAAGAGSWTSAGGLSGLARHSVWAGVPAVTGCVLGAALLVAAYTVIPQTSSSAHRAAHRGRPRTFTLGPRAGEVLR